MELGVSHFVTTGNGRKTLFSREPYPLILVSDYDCYCSSKSKSKMWSTDILGLSVETDHIVVLISLCSKLLVACGFIVYLVQCVTWYLDFNMWFCFELHGS